MGVYEAKILDTTWWIDLENIGFLRGIVQGVELHIKSEELHKLSDKYKVKPKILAGG